MYVFLVFPLEFVLHSMKCILLGIVWLFRRIRTTCGTLAAGCAEGRKRNRYPTHYPVSCLTNPSPSPPTRPDDAEDFALRHFEPLEDYSRRRMGQLGHPRKSHLASYDVDFDFRHAAFFPKERTGGENSPGARINLNSGVLNPKLASRLHVRPCGVRTLGKGSVTG